MIAEDKIIIMVAGPNGSGKSTLTRTIQDKIPNWNEFYINPDEITKSISYYLIYNFLQLNSDIEEAFINSRINIDQLLEIMILDKDLKFHENFNILNLEEIGSKFYMVPRQNFKEKQVKLAKEFIANKALFKEITSLFDEEIKKRINYILNTDNRFLNILTGINLVSAEAADIMKLEKVGHGEPVFFETVMSTVKNIEFLNVAKAKNYKIITIFVTTQDPEINLGRIKSRVMNGGHDVPEETVKRRFYSSLALLPKAITVSNVIHVYDNSKDEPEAVYLQKEELTTTLQKREALERIMKITNSIMFKGYFSIKGQDSKRILLKDDTYSELLKKQKMQRDIQKIISEEIVVMANDF